MVLNVPKTVAVKMMVNVIHKMVNVYVLPAGLVMYVLINALLDRMDQIVKSPVNVSKEHLVIILLENVNALLAIWVIAVLMNVPVIYMV